ncbi:hypothetical protein GCM10011519_32070 [Marmoricola endophyticus]|uniref:SGNH hydrolase-type esterase domain-containing protein n=1 Tax=Marmoricola endophyticus TaxID=2040280 RepID=A0A917BQY9_9ACTN|nr:SGNH/GDSL hydrolase family protein [Marmoricola endophyticus]GGF55722.1 hypothetical protein GCM10011519_32070 [Marmoricola endophyticus]
MPDADFAYSNLSGRRRGPVVTALGLVLPGVRRVQAQVGPYAAAWERHNAEAVASDGPLWVTLGDSMAQGVGASSPFMGWAGQLARRLDPAYRHVNLSVYGGRVADLLERQLPALEAIAPADLVTCLIGSNDLFSRRHRPLLPGALAELLERLPVGTVMATQPGGSPAALEFNRQVDAAAAAGRVVVADFRDPRMRSWRGRVAEDHFHPNDTGYAAMADLVAEAVRRR